MLSKSNFRPYQTHLYEEALHKRRLGVLVGVGGGKTGIALTLMGDLIREMEVGRVLVVSTVAIVTAVWPAQVKEWEATAGMQVELLRDPPTAELRKKVDEQWAKRRKTLEPKWGAEYDEAHVGENHREAHIQAKAGAWRKHWLKRMRSRWFRDTATNSPALIHLINVELFADLCAEMTQEEWPYDAVVFDESTLFANSQSKRFTAYKPFAHIPNRVLLLSGSMFSRGVEAVWSQVWLLDGGKRLGSTLSGFRQRYADPHPYLPNVWTYRDGVEDQIKEAIADICVAVDPSAFLDIKEDVHVQVPVSLPATAQRKVDTLREEYLLQLDNHFIEAANAAVLINKLRQLCNGFAYTDEDGGWEEIHTAKTDRLVELIAEINAPVIVLYEYKADLQRIKAALPQAVVFNKSATMVDMWNEGVIPVLLLNPLSASHGLNLQHGGHHMIEFAPMWSLELTEQAHGRIGKERQAQSGLNRAAFYYQLITDDGAEQQVIRRLRARKDLRDVFTRHLMLEMEDI